MADVSASKLSMRACVWLIGGGRSCGLSARNRSILVCPGNSESSGLKQTFNASPLLDVHKPRALIIEDEHRHIAGDMHHDLRRAAFAAFILDSA